MSHISDLEEQIDTIQIKRDDLALDLESQIAEEVIREMRIQLMTLDSDLELLRRLVRLEGNL